MTNVHRDLTFQSWVFLIGGEPNNCSALGSLEIFHLFETNVCNSTLRLRQIINVNRHTMLSKAEPLSSPVIAGLGSIGLCTLDLGEWRSQYKDI